VFIYNYKTLINRYIEDNDKASDSYDMKTLFRAGILESRIDIEFRKHLHTLSWQHPQYKESG
jgi:hypothetical protein